MVALIREPPAQDGPTRRVSLRSSAEYLDVSAIARAAGGGGHRQAAGFSSDDSMDEIMDFIRREYAEPAEGRDASRPEWSRARRQAGRAVVVRDGSAAPR